MSPLMGAPAPWDVPPRPAPWAEATGSKFEGPTFCEVDLRPLRLRVASEDVEVPGGYTMV